MIIQRNKPGTEELRKYAVPSNYREAECFAFLHTLEGFSKPEIWLCDYSLNGDIREGKILVYRYLTSTTDEAIMRHFEKGLEKAVSQVAVHNFIASEAEVILRDK